MSDDETHGPTPRPFPPFPSIKAPPPGRGLDPRQAHALKLDEGLAGRLPTAVDTGVGFRASSVDLGELKELIEGGTRRLTLQQLHTRWDDDVRGFIHSVVTSWVQRPRDIAGELLADRVRVRFVTQDDHGEYSYAFDVFPKEPVTASDALGAAEIALLREVRLSDEDHGGLDSRELSRDEYDTMDRLCALGLVEAIGEYGEAPDGEEDEREAGDSEIVYRVTGAGVAALAERG